MQGRQLLRILSSKIPNYARISDAISYQTSSKDLITITKTGSNHYCILHFSQLKAYHEITTLRLCTRTRTFVIRGFRVGEAENPCRRIRRSHLSKTQQCGSARGLSQPEAVLRLVLLYAFQKWDTYSSIKKVFCFTELDGLRSTNIFYREAWFS